MAVNKVEYNDNGQIKTLIDLTADTVTADKLAKGYTAHDMSGNIITGTMESGNSLIPWDISKFGVYYCSNLNNETYSSLNGESSYSVVGSRNYDSYNSGFKSTATSDDIGKSIFNYLTTYTQEYRYGPWSHVESNGIKQILLKYNSCSLTSGTDVNESITMVDKNGIILFVGTWSEAKTALNNKSIDMTNGIAFVGNYSYTTKPSSTSYSQTKLVFN